MQNSGGNFPINSFPFFKNIGNKAKNFINKINQNNLQNSPQNTIKDINQNQPNKSLVNTNSNININQQTQTSPAVTQTALNAVNKPVDQGQTQAAKNESNIKMQQQSAQSNFNGPRDIPTYAGIPNMSMKSWVANQQDKSFAKLESGDKELKATLEGIKGFQRHNQEGSTGNSGQDQGGEANKKRMLLILSHIFSSIRQTPQQKSEFINNFMTFRKLGSNMQEHKSLPGQEEYFDLKSAPPMPNELNALKNLNEGNVRYLHELIALPSEFPEFLRLFAKDRIDLNPRELRQFLEHRFQIAQEQLFEGNSGLSKMLERYVPLLNVSENYFLLPLILLYYPLPFPYIRQDFDFMRAWKKKGTADKDLIASCEIYYHSNVKGRFLIKLELDKNKELSFDIQTAEKNNNVVKDLENSIAGIMVLLEHPPELSDLNILLTKEVYKATDIDEELSIVSSGPLRIEIILAVYGALIVLNKLNKEQDPAGLIEME